MTRRAYLGTKLVDLGAQQRALLRQPPGAARRVRQRDGQREDVEGQVEDRERKERVRGYLDGDGSRHALQQVGKEREQQDQGGREQPEHAVPQAQPLEAHQVQNPSEEYEQRRAGGDLQFERQQSWRHPAISGLWWRSAGRSISASETLIR